MVGEQVILCESFSMGSSHSTFQLYSLILRYNVSAVAVYTFLDVWTLENHFLLDTIFLILVIL